MLANIVLYEQQRSHAACAMRAVSFLRAGEAPIDKSFGLSPVLRAVLMLTLIFVGRMYFPA